MLNPWDVRPRCKRGDDTPEPIYLKVGEALTAWEHLESKLAELFDCLVSGAPSAMQSNRAGFCAFVAVKTSSARTELLQAAAPRALDGSKHLAWAADFLSRVSHFGARRNELAHGMVFNLGEHGFQLGPNNTMPTKWHKKGQQAGSATFQYGSADVSHYADEFSKLYAECLLLIEAIQSERGKQN